MKLTKQRLRQIIREELRDLSEVYSKKQRAWACAQEGAEFEEMCTGPMKKEGQKDTPAKD